MGKRILIIHGHPDAGAKNCLHALADSDAGTAREHGHELRRIDVARLDFPVLRSAQDRGAHVVVTMGMPAWVCRPAFGAHRCENWRARMRDDGRRAR